MPKYEFEADPSEVAKYQIDPAWKKAIRAGIRDNIDNIELLGTVDLSPVTLSGNLDPREFWQLSRGARAFILREAFDRIGYHPDKTHFLEAYSFEHYPRGWKKPHPVKRNFAEVFATRRLEEGLALHRITIPTYRPRTEYMIASAAFRPDNYIHERLPEGATYAPTSNPDMML